MFRPNVSLYTGYLVSTYHMGKITGHQYIQRSILTKDQADHLELVGRLALMLIFDNYIETNHLAHSRDELTNDSSIIY